MDGRLLVVRRMATKPTDPSAIARSATP